MSWDESRYGLGVAEMDATHREFVVMAEALQGASDEQFLVLFEELHAHTLAHFDNEKKLMRACRFPAIGEHEREHLRVLGELAHFARAARNGRLNMARAYVAGLPGWFDTHLATMDSALAACLKAQQ